MSLLIVLQEPPGASSHPTSCGPPPSRLLHPWPRLLGSDTRHRVHLPRERSVPHLMEGVATTIHAPGTQGGALSEPEPASGRPQT